MNNLSPNINILLLDSNPTRQVPGSREKDSLLFVLPPPSPDYIPPSPPPKHTKSEALEIFGSSQPNTIPNRGNTWRKFHDP